MAALYGPMTRDYGDPGSLLRRAYAMAEPADREVFVKVMDRLGDRPESREPDICSRCAAKGQTCCELTPGQEEQCFPLSEVERHRIVEYLGLDRGAFTPEPNSGAFRANLHRLFPNERRVVDALFPETDRHLRLSVDAAGRCVFLQGHGCLLPRPVRPYYCRLFPFWVAAGRVTAFAAAECLVHRQGRTVSAMLTLLGATEAQTRELHGRLRLAWGLPPKEGMPFVTPSSARFAT
jgi:Fe-S-cluster containining protein